MDMKRTRPAKLLDRVRSLLANRISPEKIEEVLKDEFQIEPLTKCTGEAHTNAFIDNCGMCAPRWGWTGDKIKIT